VPKVEVRQGRELLNIKKRLARSAAFPHNFNDWIYPDYGIVVLKFNENPSLRFSFSRHFSIPQNASGSVWKKTRPDKAEVKVNLF